MKNTSCILHSTRQIITWKHAADKNMNCMQQHKKIRKARGWTWTACYTKPNITHVDREAHGWSELETASSHNKTKHGAWVSEPLTWSQNWAWTRHECRDPNTKLQHETRKQGIQIWVHLKPHAHKKTKTWRECQGSLDRSDRTLTITSW